MRTAAPLPPRFRWPRRGWALALRLLIAAVLVSWLLRSGRLDWRMMAAVELGGFLLASALCRMAASLLRLVRWHLLCRALGLELGLGKAIHIGLIGYFLGIAVPSSVGVDATRLYYGSREQPNSGAALLSTILADRLLGILALLILALGFGGALAVSGGPEELGVTLLFLLGALLAVAAMAAVYWRWNWLERLEPFLPWKALRDLMAATHEYRRHRGVLVRAMLLSFLCHGAVMAAAYCTFRAIGVVPPVLAVCVVMPLSSLAWGLPVTPLGLGVVDSLAEALYSLLGAPGGAEITMIMRAVSVAVSLAYGLAYLVPVGRDRQAQTAAAHGAGE